MQYKGYEKGQGLTSLTVIAFPSLCAAAGADSEDAVTCLTDVCAVAFLLTIRSESPCWTILNQNQD